MPIKSLIGKVVAIGIWFVSSSIHQQASAAAELIYPQPDQVVGGDVEFGWTIDPGALKYWLRVLGQDGQNYGDQWAYDSTTNSTVIKDVPIGMPLRAELTTVYRVGASAENWDAKQVIYLNATVASIISPVSETLDSSTVTFQWNPVGGSTLFYWVLTDEYANSWFNNYVEQQTSVTLNNLPTDGRRLFSELYTIVGNDWSRVSTRVFVTHFANHVADLVVTNPDVTVSGKTHSVVTDSGVIDPAVKDPGVTDSGVTDPDVTNPGIADPGNTGPRVADVWRPAPGTSWQWQLTGDINTSYDVEMYNIDLFDAPQSVINSLHADGKIVICYFSAGSYENWRRDAGAFTDEVKGQSNGWIGEKWLDIRAMNVLAPIMRARLDLAVAKGCDGVEPDNVDAYTNNTGFALTAGDQLTYNRWIADEAHQRGLSVGLKNDLNQVEALEPWFDWALSEQCAQYNECELLAPFTDAGKAVFGVEYTGDPARYCPELNAMNYDWLIKELDLGDSYNSCR